MMFFFVLLRLLFLPVIASAQIETPPERLQGSDSCLIATRAIQHREQRYYRAVVFGQRPAERARTGTMRYDLDGNPWLKTGESAWQSMATGYQGTTQGDAGMDGIAEFSNRRGILETRKALTSELIEPLTQSLRALRCRLLTSCYAAQNSDRSNGGEPIVLRAPGCLPVEIAPISACAVPNESVILETVRLCHIDAQSLLSREAAILPAVIAYDAAYRSLAQFAGIFRGLFEDMRDPVLGPLQTTLRVVRSFQTIPCFLSQCNE